MSAPAFTPGPWEFVGPVRAVGKGERAGKVAEVSIAFKDSATRDANGFLIAAAPELYEALEAIMGAIDYVNALPGDKGREITKAAYRALAKARGE